MAVPVTFLNVVPTDFDELADIRVAAMRESLERVGRFDPVRARERLRGTFSPEHTWFVLFEGIKVGFYAVRPDREGMQLDHLYILPSHQKRGIGGAVMQAITDEADKRGLVILTGALKGSGSNRFYQRCGFALVREGEWDNYYARPASTVAEDG